MEHTLAASRPSGNVNFPLNQPSKPRHHSPPTYLDWHAHIRQRVPDARARDVLIVLAGLMDDNGHITGLCYRELGSACGIRSESTLRRRLRKLAKLGEITIHTRRVARDFNAPNTYIIKNHAGFRGGGVHFCEGEALKAEYIKHPAGARVGYSPVPPQPIPARPRTRHIVASSQIANEFCAGRNIPRSRHYERMRLTQRIEDRLNAGDEESAIVADLDREYRARSVPVSPHRGTWHSCRSEADERMARDLYTQTRQLTQEEFGKLEAREREAKAHEAAGYRWSILKDCWVPASQTGGRP